MPADLPLVTVIVQVLRHTPLWVWGVLGLLIAIGLRQAFDSVVSRRRLTLMPIALGVYSLYGATTMFGPRPDVIAAWALALLAIVAINQWLRWPADAKPAGDDRFAVSGSVWPLALMVAVFALRYVGKVTLIFHPEWAADAAFSLTLAAGYGALSGVFAARALRILRSGRAVPIAAPLHAASAA